MMPWYPDQFAGSTRCFSFNERSAYRALLDVQWAIGPLPSDPLRLAEAIGMDPADFSKAWEVVGAKFVPVAGGIVNKRLESHRLASLERKKKASRAGRTGGKASGEARRQRPLKQSSTDASSNRPTAVERDPNPLSPSPSPVSKTPNPAQRGGSFLNGAEPEESPSGVRSTPREEGSNPRAQGTNRRATGGNPRALGTNPRAQAEAEAFEQARQQILPTFRDPYPVETLEAYRTALKVAAPRPAGAPRFGIPAAPKGRT